LQAEQANFLLIGSGIKEVFEKPKLG